ncbi:OmpA family protein [candidate division WOR-3 bacterium]|uniref:OmpA family protein n=1 Tax=candidate division WOR-3 bacterium TaxID=2052148 RepID=A0A9D5KBZ6_UNCW3|nr:OmpA family protein [candidate division WOR-3 bacterium]MBD3364941.1 OmpA family protein [candidate division WOR-3 bacterium]
MKCQRILPVFLLFACCLYADTDKIRARDYKVFIRTNAPSEEAFVAVQSLAEPYIVTDEWEKAVNVFQKYQRLFPGLNKRFDRIINILEAEEEGLEITNLGKTINSKGNEGFPVPSADGRYLFFTGKDREGCLGGEDVFVSEASQSSWHEVRPIEGDINTVEGNESLTSISFDGNKLLILGGYEEGRGRADIFYVERTEDGWSDVEHLPWPINSTGFDSDAFITSDGMAILFTSDRRGVTGNYHQKGAAFHGNFWGNTDIFVCEKLDTGWGPAINLGSMINTPYAERTPFLHPDGKTLYFSSDGHYGIGRLDVFKSIRLSEDSWTKWSEPVNLGKEINTSRDDMGYKITTTGEEAYFSAFSTDTLEGSYGAFDIYRVTLPSTARPEVVATVKGMVTDQDGNPLAATIYWEDLSTGRNIGESGVNPQDGSYFIALPLGKNYGYYAEKQGYYPVSENLDLSTDTQAVEITEDIVLVAIQELKKTGKPVRINNIFFDFDAYRLKPESYPELDRLAEILKENPDMKVAIAGHTDNVGDEYYNMKLSKNRAISVVTYLIQHGCKIDNLDPEGYGESKPVDTNETEEGRAQNRRVEFKVVRE